MQVAAPKGYHWMKHGKSFKLMKDPAGGFKPHKGASKKANFEIQKVHKKYWRLPTYSLLTNCLEK